MSPDLNIHPGWSMDYRGLPPVDLSPPVTPEAAVTALLPSLEGDDARGTPDRPARPAPCGDRART